jgi:type III restriction enzyme
MCHSFSNNGADGELMERDSHLELEFAAFLQRCPDVVSYTKNYMAVHFSIDYVNADGNISNYYPDFIVKLENGQIVVVETKGLEDLDVPLKLARLASWCEDINRAQSKAHYDYVFVNEEDFERYQAKTFEDLLKAFKRYKEVLN